MGGDLVAALGRATVDGHTLFGHNSTQAPRACQALRLVPGRAFAFGEKVRTTLLELPEVRQTGTVLGSQPHGRWGYQHGVNAHGVAVGRAPLPTRLTSDGPGLTGTDLVRLALERGRTARQAVDLLADLLMRHGQAAEPGAEADGDGNVFLVADGTEAFAVECAGHFWVYQQVREVRALGGLSTVRQDWDRIAHGLAAHACERDWWPVDGSKLDFAAAVSPTPPEREPERAPDFRRWGRATLLLAEQSGHIDTAFVRRLLSDHREGENDEIDPFAPDAGAGSLCRHPRAGAAAATAASLVVALAREPGRLLTAWCAFGPPCLSVYFPVFLEGDLPAAFGRSSAEPADGSAWWQLQEVTRFLTEHPERRDLARETLGRLQARFDQEAEEFAAEGAALVRRGEHAEVQRLAPLFMEHCLERFEEAWAGVARAGAVGGAGAGPAIVPDRERCGESRMRSLVARVQRWWQPRGRSGLAVPYEVACACGHLLRGQRQEHHQVVRCPSCRESVFVLPQSPLPRWSAADLPAASRVVPRLALRPSPWRFWLWPAVFGGITVLVALAIILLVVSYLRPPHSLPGLPRESESVEEHVAEGQRFLATGQYRAAARELQRACALLEQQPERQRDVLQLRRQAELLSKLLSEPLGGILQNAATQHEEEWQGQFEAHYRGEAVVFDADVTREGADQFRLDFHVRAGAEAARIDVSDLKLLAALPRDRPPRLLFGGRLRSIAREAGGVWVVRFEPESGVLLTDAGAVAACCPPPLDEADREQRNALLQRQQEWLAEVH